MERTVDIEPSSRDGLEWAQRMVTENHYLHSPVDQRCRPLAYVIWLTTDHDVKRIGCLIYGRPEATRCYQGRLTYGSYQDVLSGRAKYDRWEILNLARVWLDPCVQKGGADYVHHAASTAIKESLQRVGFEYLQLHPPVDCSYPYKIRCVLSYCDTSKHNGWIYLASRFKLARTNENGIQTYMKTIPPMTQEQDKRIVKLSLASKRSQRIRGQREQEALQMSF